MREDHELPHSLDWVWGQHPSGTGWAIYPEHVLDEWEDQSEDSLPDASGAVMADWLYGEDVEDHLTVVDNMGVGERIHVDTETAAEAIVAALLARGDRVQRDDAGVAAIW